MTRGWEPNVSYTIQGSVQSPNSPSKGMAGCREHPVLHVYRRSEEIAFHAVIRLTRRALTLDIRVG